MQRASGDYAMAGRSERTVREGVKGSGKGRGWATLSRSVIMSTGKPTKAEKWSERKNK